MKNSIWKNYGSALILLVSIALGALIGSIMGEEATVLKPLGDLFLNMMFVVVVPLIFFSISSAIASMENKKRLGKVLGTMLAVFTLTGVIAATVALTASTLYSPSKDVALDIVQTEAPIADVSIGDQIVQTITVSNFVDLLSRNNMLALIIFSILLGFATAHLGEKGRPFAQFLQAGNDVMLAMVRYIMWYAPIGLGAYFATLIGEFGPTLLGSYLRAVLYYYPLALLYFVAFFTLYAFVGGGKKGIQRFWKHTLPPLATSLGTCSSAASLPVNLETTKQMGIPSDIRETTLPLGVSLHKDGSVMGGVLKLVFVFSVFGIEYHNVSMYAAIIGMALLVGMVMGAIPQGGMIAEMLILTLFGLPPEALPIMAALSAIIDPPATVLNVVGDNAASMMIARGVEGKEWINANADSATETTSLEKAIA